MKIKSLHIDSYRHLQNISFDFTYPEGHTKAGKPLDKICIIGQSATGKTSILELIKNSITWLNLIEVISGKYIIPYFQLDFSGQLEYLYNDSILKVTKNTIIKNGREFQNLPDGGGGSVVYLMNDGIKLLYLSSELISKDAVNIFNQNPVSISHELLSEKYSSFQKSIAVETTCTNLGKM